MKLISLSKVYTVSHIIPFDIDNHALIVDGSDMVPKQTLQYEYLPLNEVIALSQHLPSSSIEFEKEQQLFTVMQKKQRLLGSGTTFSRCIPVLMKNDVYAQAVLGCLEFSQVGEPNYGIHRVNVNYQNALELVSTIQGLSGLRDSISIIDKDCDFIKERIDPYLKRMNSCISNIDDYFSQMDAFLKERLFSEVVIHGNPLLDEQYGYGIIQHKYHIPARTVSSNLIPLSPVQAVIDNLDNMVRDPIITIRNNKKDEISRMKLSCEDIVQIINRDFDATVARLNIQITEKEADISGLSSQANARKDNANLYRNTAKDYENQADYLKTLANKEFHKAEAAKYSRNENNMNKNNERRVMCDLQTGSFERNGMDYKSQANEFEIKAKDARNKAKFEYDQAKIFMRQIFDKKIQIDQIKSNISRLESQKNSDIEKKKLAVKQQIDKLKFERDEQIKKLREHIEPIIKARNKIIEMTESAIKDISNEQDCHKLPFKFRLDSYQKFLNQYLSKMEDCSKERSKILEQIDSMKIDISNIYIPKPISIMIPYWIACLKGKVGIEYIVLPLKRSIMPDKQLKGRRTAEILTPVFESLEASKHYLLNNNINDEAAIFSIYPNNLANGIQRAIDGLSESGYLSNSIAKRIKKEYNLKDGAKIGFNN